MVVLPLYFLACVCYHSERRELCSGRVCLSQPASAVREPETSGCDPLVFAFVEVRALPDDQVIIEPPCVLGAWLRSHLPQKQSRR
jgi:hypothetical protein